MWKILQNNYFLLATDKLEIYITDYVTIWCTDFTDASFIASLKDSNVGLEMDELELLDMGKRMLMKSEELKRVRINEDGKTLNVALIQSGFPLKLFLKLTEGSKELKVTQQLLRVVQDLKCSQQELRRELLKKDEEIEEYKCEGGEIALRCLKTTSFNEKEHMNKHTVFTSHFSSSDVPEILLQNAVDVLEMKEIEVKQEVCEAVSNGSIAKIGKQDTDALNNSSIKTKNVEEETNSVKIETEIPETKEGNEDRPKVNTETEINIENVKSENSNSQISRPLVSPNKRKRSRPNFL